MIPAVGDLDPWGKGAVSRGDEVFQLYIHLSKCAWEPVAWMEVHETVVGMEVRPFKGACNYGYVGNRWPTDDTAKADRYMITFFSREGRQLITPTWCFPFLMTKFSRDGFWPSRNLVNCLTF